MTVIESDNIVLTKCPLLCLQGFVEKLSTRIYSITNSGITIPDEDNAISVVIYEDGKF